MAILLALRRWACPPRLIPLLLLAGLLAPPDMQGQDAPVALLVEPSTGALELRIGDLLEEDRFREALDEGLPLRIRVQAELWRDGFFDSQEGGAEWRATVVYDPLSRTYQFRTMDVSTEQVLGSLEQLRLVVLQSFALPLRPSRRARYYYLATLEVETFSLSDLEELQRWLRGDLGPGIAGEGGGVDGALTRGVGRLLQRALGLPTLRIRLQSAPFDFPGEGEREVEVGLAGTPTQPGAAPGEP